jgi:hypothetical protein
LLAPHPVSWLYCLAVSDTFPVVRIATLRFFLYDNMHRRLLRSLRVIARKRHMRPVLLLRRVSSQCWSKPRIKA